MTEGATPQPQGWECIYLSGSSIPIYEQIVAREKPYEDLRLQNEMLALLARRMDLITPARFKLLKDRGRVCYEAAGIVCDYMKQMEAGFAFEMKPLQFHPAIKGKVLDIESLHSGQMVALASQQENPNVAVIDMASYIFGWETPLLAVGSTTELPDLLSYLYSLHQEITTRVTL